MIHCVIGSWDIYNTTHIVSTESTVLFVVVYTVSSVVVGVWSVYSFAAEEAAASRRL